MIKFEKTEVMNFEGAIRGMRNPLNSWYKSDSRYVQLDPGTNYPDVIYKIGENDLRLMKSLVKTGSDHRKFLRQIFVSVDITAPLYWWKEFDTYKVGTVANSCSTMHTIHTKELTLDDFSYERLTEFNTVILRNYISIINDMREQYLITKNKKWWDQIIQMLPASYNQKRTITLNYEVLRNIRHSDRRNHKLDEWRIGFMEWIDSLPYAEELLIT